MPKQGRSALRRPSTMNIEKVKVEKVEKDSQDLLLQLADWIKEDKIAGKAISVVPIVAILYFGAHIRVQS